jgi:hypothetical protein
MRRRITPPSQTWRTFLTNHVQQIAAADFFVVPTATCRLLFVLLILAPERRRVVHIGVTDHPTAEWTAQQLREAFPWDEAPPYLVHDRDTAFHAWTTTAPAIGITEVVTAVRSPWQAFGWTARRRALVAFNAAGDSRVSCSRKGLVGDNLRISWVSAGGLMDLGYPAAWYGAHG